MSLAGAAYGAASSRIRRPTIGFGVQWKADMMCGNMDLQLSVKNQLNGMTDGFKSIMGNIVHSAQGAVASLPALIIQRANPGLYELLSNGVLQGRVDFDRAKISCQSILDKAGTFMDGGNLQELAKAETLHNAIKNHNGDAIAAEKEVDDVGTENGIPWMGEVRGERASNRLNSLVMWSKKRITQLTVEPLPQMQRSRQRHVMVVRFVLYGQPLKMLRILQ